jgi:sugar O-acyltransferase (sialic acid O-acetyltransferase NeuD family)
MIRDKYIVLGVGAYVSNIDEILYAQYNNRSKRSYEIIGFLDSDTQKHNKQFFGYKVLGDVNWFMNIKEKVNVVSAINPKGKKEMFSQILHNQALSFPNLIHPSASISRNVNLGKGNIFAQNVVLAPHVNIGNFNMFNYQVCIGHNCVIGDYNTLNGGAHVAGSSKIEEGCFIGPGAVIIDGITIGKGSLIGANAVVRKNIPPYVTAVGVPAEVIKRHKNK